jgi:DNA-binding transcriptional MerR regulator
MKKQPTNALYSVTEQELEALVPLFTKDHSHEALSFIRNHHRLLHYWGDGINLLPPQDDSVGKRYRFSFFDLVWLGIVKELRDYGMEKEKIAVLRDELLSPVDHKSNLRIIREHQKELEAMLSKTYGVATSDIRALLEQYAQKQEQVRPLGFTLLATYLYAIIGQKKSLRLLISKEGHHRVAVLAVDGTWVVDEEGLFSTSFVSISLSEVMHFFAARAFVKDSVKQTLLSPQEWQLIQETRAEGLKSVTVNFKDGKMQTLESTRKIKIPMEARLTEVLLKGGYENLTIVTEKGQIVYGEQTIKKRFDKHEE